MSKDADNANPMVFESENLMSDFETQIRKDQEKNPFEDDPIDKYEGYII